jgi:hypothetical protein
MLVPSLAHMQTVKDDFDPDHRTAPGRFADGSDGDEGCVSRLAWPAVGQRRLRAVVSDPRTAAGSAPYWWSKSGQCAGRAAHPRRVRRRSGG